MSSLSLYHFLVLGVIIAALVWSIRRTPKKDSTQKMFCMNCGHEDSISSKMRGSDGIELVLWLCYIVPGIIYSIWRRGKKETTCKICGSTNLIPSSSPMAIAQKKKLSS